MINKNLRRVVVTGMGAITPLGNTVKEYWEGLISGSSGIGLIDQFDTSLHTCKIAGAVKNFDPYDYLERKDVKHTSRFAQFAVSASLQAIANAGLEINDSNATQVGIILGNGIGGLAVIEEQQKSFLAHGPRRCSPFTIPMAISNIAAGMTAIYTGAKGPNFCTVTACAAGSNAIGEAFRLIQTGQVQAMICGGTEAAITPLCIAAFASAKTLSTRNDDPTRASRPFDATRNGFVMGEGSGILVIEDLEHALRRGANHIYAEIVGYGITCDAYHITTPIPNGEGATRAMELALKDARLFPNEVSYINAHGTSTTANDVTETLAIKQALGNRAWQIPISSTKSMTGHLLGASGGIEAIATVLTVGLDLIPPTINLDLPDPKCDLDYVPHESRSQRVDIALSNSFGFGGHNISLAFKKFED
ncbi:beta-ketoacyl-ACP synthase II [Anabaena cylindrica FACHB-243]|nr:MULTISPECIES: beta-ketoacyl-ACP synthase II [Anabaena]MBD2418957.1 beta-ketoacyl-ACP synthase II [Anabaena cylindrica FACHB-243]MBY5285099.1 beta-ketoacyl-ACP synthase II [Anabaena sp. CCAP 1446/1C]MBY5308831.1 beta-ketoacyl-ACP synthase II [Anabaena sp. CCAP 1446/1C]MCM2409510.1 beta-ketoacyl-ACP synthase II [Anabaena sp. CCAP 1446/1C]